MTTKDWIILFVPIFFNGVLVFLLQNFIQLKFERRKRIEQEKRLFVDHFFAHIGEAMDKTMEIERIINAERYEEVVNLHYAKLFSVMLNYAKSFSALNRFCDYIKELLRQALIIELSCDFLNRERHNYDPFSIKKVLNWDKNTEELFEISDINGLVSRVLAGLMDRYKANYTEHDIEVIKSNIDDEKWESTGERLLPYEVYRIESIARTFIEENEENRGLLGKTRIRDVNGHCFMSIDSRIMAMLLVEKGEELEKINEALKKIKNILEAMSNKCTEL